MPQQTYWFRRNVLCPRDIKQRGTRELVEILVILILNGDGNIHNQQMVLPAIYFIVILEKAMLVAGAATTTTITITTHANRNNPNTIVVCQSIKDLRVRSGLASACFSGYALDRFLTHTLRIHQIFPGLVLEYLVFFFVFLLIQATVWYTLVVENLAPCCYYCGLWLNPQIWKFLTFSHIPITTTTITNYNDNSD